MKNIFLLIFVVPALSVFGQNVGVGITTPLSKLHVKGSANTSQLIIDANSTQTNINPLIRFRSSTGADLLWIHSDHDFNVFIGHESGRVNNAAGGGFANTFIGKNVGYSNTTGNFNTALGINALYSNITGYNNIAAGNRALYLNTSGSSNTALGYYALYENKAGDLGVAIGYESQRFANSTNNNWTNLNTSVGSHSLRGSVVPANNTGQSNSAFGCEAMVNNSSGSNNTSNGYRALNQNATGSNNVAIGPYTLYSNVAGNNGVAIGDLSQRYVKNIATSWDNTNTSVGYQSLKGSSVPANNTGTDNTAIGRDALLSNTSGFQNTATGRDALVDNTSGAYNTATGVSALNSNTTGYNNAAFGAHALFLNTTGESNTAAGYEALFNNATGTHNTGVGRNGLFFNATGNYNTAVGRNALYHNVAGNNGVAIGAYSQWYANNTATVWDNTNTSVGYYSLHGTATPANNTGTNNTAIGREALYKNSSGDNNTATGYQTLVDNTSGSYNTADGYRALTSNTEGSYNTAEGYQALTGNTLGSSNTAVGVNALYTNTDGDFNTGIGRFAYYDLTGLANTTCIGNSAGGIVDASNRIEVGNTSVTFIGGQVAWSTYSDGRIKDNVVANVPGLSFINRLRPVTYNLNIHRQNDMVYSDEKKESEWTDKYAIEEIRMTGFIAQEVEQAAKDLNFDFSGVEIPADPKDLYSLRYSEFVMPLVKAVQELSEKNQAQEVLINDLMKRLEKLENPNGEN